MQKLTFAQKCIANGIFNPIEYIVKLYQKGYSTPEISEYMLDNYKISITSKGIADKVKSEITLRTYSERKINAIRRKRMVYLKKPDAEKYRTTGLSSKRRFEVLTRDGFKCTLCGNSPKTGSTLEIHHKNGNSSDLDNLQTLCFACHRGLHYAKREI